MRFSLLLRDFAAYIPFAAGRRAKADEKMKTLESCIPACIFLELRACSRPGEFCRGRRERTNYWKTNRTFSAWCRCSPGFPRRQCFTAVSHYSVSPFPCGTEPRPNDGDLFYLATTNSSQSPQRRTKSETASEHEHRPSTIFTRKHSTRQTPNTQRKPIHAHPPATLTKRDQNPLPFHFPSLDITV